MSSKGRKRKDAADGFSEFYPTPSWVTHRFIERCAFLPSGAWLEPCAGNGDIVLAINEKRPGKIHWHANELRSECEPVLKDLASNVTTGDFLQWKKEGSKAFDVIITNPPFSLALDVIKKSLELADYVVMLLRLNFIGTTERHGFFRENMPDIYVIPERPSFDGKGADSIEYCWALWSQPEKRKRSKGCIELLDTTPLAVRKACKPSNLQITVQMKALLGDSDQPENAEHPNGSPEAQEVLQSRQPDLTGLD
jgi:hypothetical protein